MKDGAPSRSCRAAAPRSSRARLTRDIREDTVFVPFHWGGPSSINRLTNPALDPTSRMPEFKVCAVRIEAPTQRHAEQAKQMFAVPTDSVSS